MKRKKLLFLLVVIISLFWLPKAQASSKYSLVKETYENIYYVQNGMPAHYGSDSQFKFTLNGITAFCMDPVMSVTKNEYYGVPLKETGYDRETQEYLNKLIYYGYDYPGHQTIRYYMATQALIWEKLTNYLIEFYTERYGYGDYIDVSPEKNEILNLINNHYNIPSFANTNYTYNLTNYLEFEDSILNEFDIAESNWNDIVIENNKLKISNLQNFVGTINIKLKKKMYRDDTLMYYYEEYTQPMITGGKPNDVEANFSIKINGTKIKVNKLDSVSNLPIKDSNIKFNIINTRTNEYAYVNGTKDIPINSEGYLITDPLPYGEYEIVEVATIDAYELSRISFLVDVNQNTANADNIYEFNFFNTLKKGNINITKIDAYSKKPLAGVEFGLYALSDIRSSDGVLHYSKNELIDKGITDENGLLQFQNLIYGDYYIRELNAVDGYSIDTDFYPIFLRDKESNITFENDLEKGSIVIKKFGQEFDRGTLNYTLKELENVEYKLIANEDIISPVGTIYYKKGDTVAIKKTDKTGMIYFNDLILGDYCFIETQTLDEYQLDESLNCYDLKTYYGLYIELVNYLKRGNIKLNKLDKDSKLLIKNSNIKFQIKNLETNQYVYLDGNNELKLNNDGYLILNNLLYGTYEIREIATNPIYEINTEPLIIEINDKTVNEENTVEANFYNSLKKGSINILKSGEKFDFKDRKYTTINLEGVEFTLIANEDIITPDGVKHYSNGEIVSIAKTDMDGILKFDNLFLGKYCLMETKTKDGYIIDANNHCFNLLDENKQEISLTNYLEKGNLKILKIDNTTKEPIKDVTFEIYVDNNLIGKFKTDESGIIEINNIPNLTYKIKEVETANGYILNDELYAIDLKKENEITVENQKKVILPNTKLNDYTIIIASGIMLTGLILYKYGYKKKSN